MANEDEAHDGAAVDIDQLVDQVFEMVDYYTEGADGEDEDDEPWRIAQALSCGDDDDGGDGDQPSEDPPADEEKPADDPPAADPPANADPPAEEKPAEDPNANKDK
jgi:hypothetical protein